jgi:uncharacterized protein
MPSTLLYSLLNAPPNKPKSQSLAPGQTAAHPLVQEASQVAYSTYVLPAIRTEVFSTLGELADKAAIQVFAKNVTSALLAPPYGPRSTLAIDPGIRTGCKVAVLDARGGFVENTVIFVGNHQSADKNRVAVERVHELVTKHEIDVIAVGNGTNGRETEMILRMGLEEAKCTTPLVLVDEAGASVYSAR